MTVVSDNDVPEMCEDTSSEHSNSDGSFGGALFISVWEVCARVAEEEGLVLYDIDVPGAKGGKGIVRVYITRSSEDVVGSSEGVVERRSGISFEDCVKVTKRLLDIDEQKGVIPENCELEVSSPGINRRLRLPEHFRGAVGERVRLKFKTSAGAYEVVTGILKECSAGGIKVDAEGGAKGIEIGLEQIKEARVDFRF